MAIEIELDDALAIVEGMDQPGLGGSNGGRAIKAGSRIHGIGPQ